MRLPRLRVRRRTCLALAVIAGVMTWAVARESPKEMVERLGGRVGQEYVGPAWVGKGLAALPGGNRVLHEGLGTIIDVDLRDRSIDRHAVQKLQACPQLRRISLSGTSVGDDELPILGGFHALAEVDLSRTSVTDDGLAHLTPLTGLTALVVAGTSVSDNGLRHLTGFRRLELLDLTQTHVHGPGLAYLARLREFEALDLSDCRIRDEDLEHLGQCQVMSLALCRTPIGDPGLEHLATLPRLIEVNLAGTQITDAALQTFPIFPHLNIVDVTGTRVTADGIREFRAQHPGIRIIEDSRHARRE